MLCMQYQYKLLQEAIAIDAPSAITVMTVELSIQQYIPFY